MTMGKASSMGLGIGGAPQDRLHVPFVCPGCGEECPFPTQVFEHLRPGQDPSELMSTCGCGMTHKLTRASGAVSEVPAGVSIDKGWRDKYETKLRAEREQQDAVRAKELEGKCHACKQPLPPKEA